MSNVRCADCDGAWTRRPKQNVFDATWEKEEEVINADNNKNAYNSYPNFCQ